MKRTIFVIMAVFSVFAMIMAGCGGDSGAKYTVTFESNGGTLIDSITDVTSGSTITKPEDPEKPAFTFDAWYKDNELTNKWIFESDKVTGDIKLYAKYTKNNPESDDQGRAAYFTVTLMLDATTTINAYEVGYGNRIVRPVDPVKENNYFDGWYRGTTNTAKKWIFATDTVTDNITLYAKFSEITSGPYRVQFSADGRLFKVISNLQSGSKITRPSPNPEKEDFDFAGWYKEEEFLNRWNFDNDTVTRNLVLYAYFTPVVDEPPEDLARAEKVSLTNAWYVVYCFELPGGKTVSDYAELRAYYTLTTTELKNGVARGARLMGPYPKEFFQMVMGDATGSAPGKGLAIASYNLANAPYILDNSNAWGKEGGAGGDDEGKGTLKQKLEDVLGYAPTACEWFDLAYAIDGSKKHADYGKDVTLGEPPLLFYALGLPGQTKAGLPEAYVNTFYIRDVKLKVQKGADKTSSEDIVGRPVLFVKDGYKYPAFSGYVNTNGSAGHKEASRESCDNLNPAIEISVTW